MRRLVLNKWTLLVLLVLTGIVLWPGRYTTDDVWPGLSANLFASVVTIGFTIFGIDALLKGIEARRSERRSRAARAEISRSVAWILNRFYLAAPSVVKLFAPARDNFPHDLAKWAGAHLLEFRGAMLVAPVTEVEAVLTEARERLPHLRTVLFLSGDAIPDAAVAQLIEAIGVLEAAGGYRLSAQDADGVSDADSVVARVLVANGLSSLASGYVVLEPKGSAVAKR